MKIIVTQEDALNSYYTDPSNCAMAKAIKKALNIDNISFCMNYVRDSSTKKILAKIDPEYNACTNSRLKNGEIKEFITEYTPIL